MLLYTLKLHILNGLYISIFSFKDFYYSTFFLIISIQMQNYQYF